LSGRLRRQASILGEGRPEFVLIKRKEGPGGPILNPYLDHAIARFINFLHFLHKVTKILKLLPCWCEDGAVLDRHQLYIFGGNNQSKQGHSFSPCFEELIYLRRTLLLIQNII
jgi:hypothetical protein